MDVPRILQKPPYQTWLALDLWISHIQTCHELDLGISHEFDIWMCLCHDVWTFHKLQEPPYQKWQWFDFWMSHTNVSRTWLRKESRTRYMNVSVPRTAGAALSEMASARQVSCCACAQGVVSPEYRCNILQHTATHCNTMQYNTIHCNSRQMLRLCSTQCNTL